ncbi:MAG: hypothetical protein ACR2P5_06320 [Gammaproteobacteria bacterium]
MSKRTVLQIYAAAVCFFSAAAGVVSLINMSHGALSLAAPEFFMRGEIYGAHQTNRAFVRWHAREDRLWGRDAENAAQRLPENEKELTALRAESFAAAIATERHNAAGSLANSFIAALLCAALFFPHWRQMQKRAEE